MRRPVVYLGPSLALAEARQVLDADYRPPIKRGDLMQLDEDVGTVAIIDGVFLQNCSVGHREILHIMRNGVKVFGAGSMGALRAAELQSLGMIGIGRIFQMYLDGEIEGDDEVALVFDPDTLEPLSEPMVNIRVLLNEAVDEGVVKSATRQLLLERFRAIYYPRRTLPALMGLIGDLDDANEAEILARYFDVKYRDIKKEDAIALLNTLINSP